MLKKIVPILVAYTVDAGTTEQLDTTNDVAVMDVRHCTNIEVFVNQIVDAGTCTIDIERTLDGVNWDPVGQFTEASFPAGANKAQSLLLVDVNGMPLLAKQIRVKLTAVAGGGSYTVLGYGVQRDPSERLIIDAGTLTTDADSDGLMEAVNDAITFSAEGLTNIALLLNQIVDPGVGTCAIIVERSIDGVNWDELATVADTDFVAAANVSFPVSLSGTGGRPMHAKLIRARLSALSAGGAWTATLVGIQIPGYR
jgi:hypothetical protein